MQPRHPHVLPLQLFAQHAKGVVSAVGPDVGGPRQPAQRLVVVFVGKNVRALEPLQLQPVLEQPQELVGRRQVRRVVAADVAALAERGQRVDRRRHVQRFVVAAVHQLQQLDRELDVAQPTGTEFDLAGPHSCGHVLDDAPAHRLHLGNEVLPFARRPHHRHQRIDVLLAELSVTDRGPRLHQRLELPRLGPALVVGDMGVQSAHQLAVFALGAQRRVHFEERIPGEPHHLARHPGGDRETVLRALGHEDHVDVADVVQLTRAALAHRDDGQPWRLVASHRLVRNGHRSTERGVGKVGQMLADSRERQDGFVLDSRRQVQTREHQQPVAIKALQRLQRIPCVRCLFGKVAKGGAQHVGRRQRHASRQQLPAVGVWRPDGHRGPATSRALRTAGRAGRGRRPVPD